MAGAEGTVAEVVRVTREDVPPDGSAPGTTRLLAKRFGIGNDPVARIWRDHNLKPWRVKIFRLSSDPHFDDKLVDVVGLYLDPPGRAVVFSFDEKTQCQALDRTQPSPPLRPGRAATMTHDYKRNGTTDALNIATGEVITECRKRRTPCRRARPLREERPLRAPPTRHPRRTRHLSAHMAPEVTDWLAHRKRSRWHLHFTPTSSSWLNLVERWFTELTERRLRCGVFTSVSDLVEAITTGGALERRPKALHLA